MVAGGRRLNRPFTRSPRPRPTIRAPRRGKPRPLRMMWRIVFWMSGPKSRPETINTNNCLAWKPACQGDMAAILTAEDMTIAVLWFDGLRKKSGEAAVSSHCVAV